MLIQPGAATEAPINPTYNYEHFSQLSGPFTTIGNKQYRVKYRRLMNRRDSLKALVLVLANLGFQIAFLIWLFLPSHIQFDSLHGSTKAGVIFILSAIAVIEGFRLFNVMSMCISTLLAKEPLPVQPQKGRRVAFTTTIVPGKEPFELAEKTLRQMRTVTYDGQLDVWLLDEGDDPDIRAACAAMGVKHFSRKGVAKWNTLSGSFKAKTKHGNHNAWLDAHGDDYDYVLSVDTDHVPFANFADRLLGYFRDPDVAFVVGPQVYGNYDNFVTKGAESQAYLFQATIQRGGNAYQNAMFVGTNHAYRVAAWKAIGGFQDSITEDMLTSMVIHSNRNAATGNYWKSVYSPDVVAVGEGPSSWTDFFSQQLRWARGSNEVLVTKFWRLLRKLPLKSGFHYSLLIMYYPSLAISWVYGMMANMVYLLLGQTGLHITGDIWLALYVNVIVAQIMLYGWLRKFNVSPHEKAGSIGFAGMLFSLIATPIYVTSLLSTFLRRSPRFVVTAKGDATSPDNLMTFKRHGLWALLVIELFVYSLYSHHAYPIIIAWSVLNLAICLSPLLVWQTGNWHYTKARLKTRLSPRKLIKLTTYKEVHETVETI